MLGAIIASLLAIAPVGAAEWVPIPVREFCGVNTQKDSSRIADCESPDAQNVLTDDGKLEKMPGNVRLATILDGYAVKFANEIIMPSGSRYLIAHASTTIYKTDLSSGSLVSIGTTSANGVLDTVTAYGKGFFQDGVANAWEWNETSTATVPTMPIAKYIEFGDERVYVANIPGESSSRVRVSSFGSTSYFTVPANVSSQADAPNSFDFQKDDGDAINCFKITPWGKFVGKGRSTHILKGYDNLTYYKKVIDPNIGCSDDRSVQMVDGLLIWLADDGIYAWNGNGPPILISRDIEPTVRRIRQLVSAAASWTVDTAADFQQGSRSTNGPAYAWDWTSVPGSIIPSSTTFLDTSSDTWVNGTVSSITATDLPGSIQLSSSSYRDSFEDGDFSAGAATWTATSGSWSIATIGSTKYLKGETGADQDRIHTTAVRIASGTWRWTSRFVGENQCSTDSEAFCYEFRFQKVSDDYYALRIRFDSVNYQQLIKKVGGTTTILASTNFTYSPNTDYAFRVDKTTDGRFYAYRDGVLISSTTDIAISSPGFTEIAASNNRDPNHFTSIFAYQYQASGRYTSRIFDMAISTPVYGVLSATCTSVAQGGHAAFYTQTSTAADGGGFSTLATTSDTIRITSPGVRYARYVMDMFTSITTMTPVCTDIKIVAIATGTYDTTVHFIGTQITSQREFVATDATSGSGLSYFVRTATYSFESDAAAPVWKVQPNNFNVVYGTGSYVQFRVDSSSISTSSDTAQVYRMAYNWVEGTQNPVASGYDKHRYFLCVQISSTSTSNDKCLVYQKNNKWTNWAGPSVYSMGRFDNNLIAGDASTDSKVWKIMQDDVYNFDGSPISAYWISKDFTLDAPFNDKILHEIWVDSVRQSSATLNVSYAVNRSTSFVSYGYNLHDTADMSIKRIPLDAGYERGKYLKFKLSNSTLDHNFGINEYLFLAEPQDRKPE